MVKDEKTDRMNNLGPMFRLITPALVGIIGGMINSNLSSLKTELNANFNGLKSEVTAVKSDFNAHTDKIERYMIWSTEKMYNNDKRIGVIEAIAEDRNIKITDEGFERRMKGRFKSGT